MVDVSLVLSPHFGLLLTITASLSVWSQCRPHCLSQRWKCYGSGQAGYALFSPGGILRIACVSDYILTAEPIAFFGGNSTKATSGINGALTRTQTDLGINDSVKTFYEDTLKSARDKARPELIKVLTYQSASAVEWLQDVFNLDLTLVSRLGLVSSPHLPRQGILTAAVVTPSPGHIVATMPSSPEWPSPTPLCSDWKRSA